MQWIILASGFLVGAFVASMVALYLLKKTILRLSTNTGERRSFVMAMFQGCREKLVCLRFDDGEIRRIPLGELLDEMLMTLDHHKHQ